MNNIIKYASLVKFSHTIFAMPFAMIGFFYSATLAGGELTLLLLLKVILCMVFARNAAMAFNRYIDRDVDGLNPRTATREIPAGVIKENSAVWFIVINSLAFILTAFFINTLCFYLSPIALLVILSYSLFKRFSALCHIILGIALSIAPTGASLAVLGEFHFFPMMISGVVIFWVSGFDILYALQDREFDKSNNLKSIPAFFGLNGALIVSALLHLFAISMVYFVGFVFELNILYFIGATIFAIILAWEHMVVKPSDISRVNLAFATMNGVASIVFSLFTIISFYLL